MVDELSGPQQVRRYRRSSEVIREITTGATSSFFLLPSFFHPSIPPELHVPLSFLGEKNLRVQMSNIDATDIDMKSCVLKQDSVSYIRLIPRR